MAEDTVKVRGTASLCVLLGRTLFNFGATTQRIQDSIEHLAQHLGCKVDMLLSYDALLITVDDGETLWTRIDSSHRFAGLNLVGLVKVSQWLRTLPDLPPNPAQLDRELTAIRDQAPTHGIMPLAFAAACAGAAFCIVNLGDPTSWICSAAGSALIFGVRRNLLSYKFNIFVAIFASALAGSVVSGLLGLLLKTGSPVVTLIAPLLFMVPGVPLITGGIDIIRNHVTIGVARIGYALAVLVALCLGVGLTLPILRLHRGPPFMLPPAEQICLLSAAGALGSGALACLNNGGPSVIALCALGGLIARLIRAIATVNGVDVITASLIGVICSTLVVGFIAGRLRWPAIIATVMAALPMIPGYFAIDGLHTTLLFATSSAPDPAQLIIGFQSLWRALFISVALVVGVIGPMAALQRNKEII
jgi:uncharacterized membrane protein YjjP (DUF1212 family)